MTEKQPGPAISQEDVESATEGFKQWIATLPEDQQRVFGWILTRAATADNEKAVQFGMETQGNVDISTLMADAAGIGQSADVAGYMLSTSPTHLTDIDPITIWTYKW
jgi:glutamate mutase epsilon subunit